MPALPPGFDENRSLWIDELERPPPRPPLIGDQTADVAVIGAGFTGMSTAWHLVERYPEKRIVVLEAVRIANGASGRNGGMMLGWKDGLASGDWERVRRSYQAGMEGMGLIEEILARCDASHLCRRQGSVDLFTDPRAVEAASQEVERLRSEGVPFEFLDRAQLVDRLGIANAEGGELDPDAGQLDGVGMLHAMAPVLEAQGVELHEGSPVTRIREGAHIELELPRGTVRAGAVVLATNAYTPALGYFRHGLFALHSHVVGSAPLSPEEWAARGWKGTYGFADDSDRVAYGAVNPRGQLVFGGGSNASYDYRYGGATAHTGSRQAAVAAVKAKLRHYYPQLSDLELPHVWSGPLGITLSRVPAIGVRGEHKNVYYAVGFSGHGVTLTNLAGKVLRDLYAGDADRWREHSFFQQRLLPIPPEPLRWVGYQVYTRLTGRSPRRRMVVR